MRPSAAPCSAHSHKFRTESDYLAAVENVRPWPGESFVIGECADCGSTLAWETVPKANPPRVYIGLSWPSPRGLRAVVAQRGDKWYVRTDDGSHLEPFVTAGIEQEIARDTSKENPMRRNPATGPTTLNTRGSVEIEFTPLDQLHEDQISNLPRRAFSDDEWSQIDEGVRSTITETDAESQDKIKALAKLFIDRYEWAMDPPDDLFARVESDFEDYLRNANDNELYEKFLNDRLAATLIFRLRMNDGYTEEAIHQAVTNTLQSANAYVFTDETSEHKAAFWKGQADNGGAYASHEDYGEVIYAPRGYAIESEPAIPFERERGMYWNEIEEAALEVNRKTPIQTRDILNAIREKHEFNAYFGDENVHYVDANIEWQVFDAMVNVELGELQPDEDEDGEMPELAGATYADKEDRVVYTFADGFYVKDLVPDELAAEGKTMGMCVGRPDMGYGQALKDGEIRILSLRRPSGKPLFTIEARLGRSTAGGIAIFGIQQIKGKANRLPGFDFGKDGSTITDNVKWDEIDKVMEFLVSWPGTSQVDLYKIHDLAPARGIARFAAKVDPVKKHAARGEKILALLQRHHPDWGRPTENPARRRPAVAPKSCAVGGNHALCTGFCVPYQSRA